MERILLLVAAPGTKILTDRVVERIQPVVGGRCLQSTPSRWLAINEAWEISCNFDDHTECPTRFVELVIDTLKGLAVDVHLIEVHSALRRKKLLIADMDSTIINQECIDEIAGFAGVKDRVSAITERAMAGELDFDAALRERVGLLKDLDENILNHVLEQRLTLMAGARVLVQTMRADGAFCALVSGGFSYFTSRIADKVGFHANQANELDVVDGILTGTVASPILGRQAKLDALRNFTKDRNLKPVQTLAVGDGANDLKMIKAAGLGVAYRAKPIVSAEAATSITHGDLTSLLYLQGYTSDEFVSQ